VGVTCIVAVIVAVVAFIAVKAPILPEPLAAKPMLVVLLVQVYVVVPPEFEVAKFIAGVLVALQTKRSDGWVISPVGFTVIVKLTGDPMQDVAPFVKVGVTIIVAIFGDVVVFIAVKAPILPDPLADNPILGVLFVQA
jgi:hypothetical protein